MAPPPQSPANPRKRRASQSTGASAGAAPAMSPTSPLGGEASTSAAATPSGEESGKKKGRTNTPWTPAEEQRLKTMRDAGLSWGEIAKVELLSTRWKGPANQISVFSVTNRGQCEETLVQGQSLGSDIALA